MDNHWVVPYNPYLTRHFKAHINIEVCSSAQAIKYIYKYIYKGSDCTTIQIDIENDKIAQYLQDNIYRNNQSYVVNICVPNT